MLKMFGGTLVNTNHIVRAEGIPPSQAGSPRVRLTLIDGHTAVEDGQTLEQMNYHAAAIVSAPFGCNVIVPSPPDKDSDE